MNHADTNKLEMRLCTTNLTNFFAAGGNVGLIAGVAGGALVAVVAIGAATWAYLHGSPCDESANPKTSQTGDQGISMSSPVPKAAPPANEGRADQEHVKTAELVSSLRESSSNSASAASKSSSICHEGMVSRDYTDGLGDEFFEQSFSDNEEQQRQVSEYNESRGPSETAETLGIYHTGFESTTQLADLSGLDL